MHFRHTRFLGAFLGILIFCAMGGPAAADGKEPRKVAILPFTMNAAQDLGFLREGIMDMIASRLAWKGEVEIVEKGRVKAAVSQAKGPLDKEKAVRIAKALGADYVILGSVTVFGESVSIDARILDVEKSEELVTAFNQSKGMDEVIPTVNQFALDINEKIMGRAVEKRAYAPPARAPRGQGALISAGGQEGPQRPSYVQRFKTEITGLDVGDVDGDGKNDLVLINKDTVFVYRWTQGSLAKLAAFEGGLSADYVYVSLGDMDGDGRSEVYVSGLSGSSVSSVVLEWQGKGLKEVAHGQPWFFRVVDIPGRQKRLIGQKRMTDGTYHGDVEFLERQGDRFVSAGPLKLPREGNVFNFAFAILDKGKGPYTILLDPFEKLVVCGPGGEEVWRSEDYFGGGLTFMMNRELNVRDIGDIGKRVYFPSPIFLTDVDKDGQPEVVICQNHSPTLRVTGYLRDFSNGRVLFLTWDGMGLSTRWTSGKLSGAVVGYRVADVDQDGLPELVVAAVSGVGLTLKSTRSQVVVYDLK